MNESKLQAPKELQTEKVFMEDKVEALGKAWATFPVLNPAPDSKLFLS